MSALPPLLYGTAWKGAQTAPLVVKAVLSGFKGIDTACQPKHYSQYGVGDALKILDKDHGIKRESLWIQTKFTSLDGQDRSKPLPYDASAPLDEQVRQSFATSLKELNTSYIDSLVMHSPMSTREKTQTVWTEFEKLYDDGKVKQLGISNIYDPSLLEWVFSTFRIKPTIIQNRFNQEHLQFCLPILEICRDHPCVLQTFWTLTGNPWITKSSQLALLAKRQRLTLAQAWFKFLLESPRFGKGKLNILSGTTSPKHMVEDTEVARQAFNVAEQEGQPGNDDVLVEASKALENTLWGKA